MYSNVNHANGYIEEKNGNKCLIVDTTDENKKYKDAKKNIKMFGMELKTKSMQ